MTTSRPIRLLVASPFAPSAGHGVNAAPVVLYQLLSALAAQPDITVQQITVGDPKSLTDFEASTRDQLSNQGVEFLPSLLLSADTTRTRTIGKRLLHPLETDYYPIVTHRETANRRIAEIAPDALLIPWSETLTALFSTAPTVRIAYYGNPDPKNLMAQGIVARKSGRWAYWALWLLLRRQLRRFHHEIMFSYHAVGNVAANDADYYVREGHHNAFYTRNIWFDRFDGKWRSLREKLEAASPYRIVGNVGKLGATANTLGMDLLGRRILPRLAQLMGGKEYEVDIVGAGRSSDWVHQALARPEIRWLGFIDDIDRHLLSSHVFMCANNGSAYNVGHTRYLHAWSLGCCLVLHKNAALAMPEIKHGENALLGDNPEHMAELAAQALGDKALRRRLGEGGYETFTTLFTAGPVGAQLAQRIQAAVLPLSRS